MNRPRRGEIWLVDFGLPIGREQAGQRPAVIVSSNLLNESRAGVIILVPCTTTRRELPSHVELDVASGLDQISYAKCEDLKSVSEERLMRALGSVSVDAMFEITKSIRFLLDL
ncbi:MAG: type II toxin-antitoxin system PemK/MazF family toxin [Microthrixaceae bacterium]